MSTVAPPTDAYSELYTNLAKISDYELTAMGDVSKLLRSYATANNTVDKTVLDSKTMAKIDEKMANLTSSRVLSQGDLTFIKGQVSGELSLGNTDLTSAFKVFDQLGVSNADFASALAAKPPAPSKAPNDTLELELVIDGKKTTGAAGGKTTTTTTTGPSDLSKLLAETILPTNAGYAYRSAASTGALNNANKDLWASMLQVDAAGRGIQVGKNGITKADLVRASMEVMSQLISQASKDRDELEDA